MSKAVFTQGLGMEETCFTGKQWENWSYQGHKVVHYANHDFSVFFFINATLQGSFYLNQMKHVKDGDWKWEWWNIFWLKYELLRKYNSRYQPKAVCEIAN